MEMQLQTNGNVYGKLHTGQNVSFIYTEGKD